LGTDSLSEGKKKGEGAKAGEVGGSHDLRASIRLEKLISPNPSITDLFNRYCISVPSFFFPKPSAQGSKSFKKRTWSFRIVPAKWIDQYCTSLCFGLRSLRLNFIIFQPISIKETWQVHSKRARAFSSASIGLSRAPPSCQTKKRVLRAGACNRFSHVCI
jgi:hypothetical protein